MRVTATENSFIIRIYDKAGADYIASCLVECLGDEGIVKAITGAGFYKAAEKILEKCEKRGITHLTGWMTPAHARLLTRATRRFAKVQILHTNVMYGEKMVQILLERDENPTMGF